MYYRLTTLTYNQWLRLYKFGLSVSNLSNNQRTVSLITFEAEYMAVSQNSQEPLWQWLLWIFRDGHVDLIYEGLDLLYMPQNQHIHYYSHQCRKETSL